MRLPDGNIVLLLPMLLVLSCGPGATIQGSDRHTIYPVMQEKGTGKKVAKDLSSSPWVTSTPPPSAADANKAQNKNYFIVHVDKEGVIHLGDRAVTEPEFLKAAKQARQELPGVTAILFVDSGITQGIHLSAQLSDIGYKNVQIFYPTATNR
ncbi:MAG: hypothetical protein ABIJ56_15765 [Pseudomonadota bacterium]